MSAKRFRVAFSFAGEKRGFVEKVAAILAERFEEAAILYDRFHSAEFSRSDLAFYLPDLYEKEADLVVAVICPDYEGKEWCGLEWNAIYGLLKRRKIGEVMLARFGTVEARGLRGLAGYLDLDDLTPAAAANEILERLGFNEDRPKGHYTKPAAPPAAVLKTDIPHNLPTLQPFFGREDELKKIADALDPDSRTWGALIDGPGGMGKTSLAVRAAYDASPEDFQKIVFISLKSRELDDDGLRDLSGFILSGLVELFNELARELGLADIAKAPEDQRPRLLSEALRGTRTLLALDNLESLVKAERDTLFTFVKRLPAGCKAILTSRGRIGSGAEELILEKLSEAAALATLAELATHNPLLAATSEAERLVLYRETGGKPLLLRWTAGQLGRGHCLTFTDALHFIRSCPAGNDPLEFIFGDLVEDFSDAETRALCALTYFALPAKVEHLAALASLPKEDTDLALPSLTNRSLAVPTEELRTFNLVPMVADFLRKKKPEAVADTGNRLEQRAFALIVATGYDEHSRFPVLDAAWPTVAPALPLFVAGPNDRLFTVCNALATFLDFTGRWDEWLSLNQQAEMKFNAGGDYESAFAVAYQVCCVYATRKQAAELLTCVDRMDSYTRLCYLGPRQRAFAIRMRGEGLDLQGDGQGAISAFREAINLLRSLSVASPDIAMFLNKLGGAELRAGDLEGAERHLQEALSAAQTNHNPTGIALFTGNLALPALERNDWVRAESWSRRALRLVEQIGRQQSIAANCERLAEALVRQGKAVEALPYARRAVELLTRLGAPEVESAQRMLRECEEALP